MCNEVFSYLKENGLRDGAALLPSLVTASAYGTIYNAQFEEFLSGFGISLDNLPAWFRVSLLSFIMGMNNLALNLTENRKHWEGIKHLYRTGQLRQAIVDRIKNHPLETIIASIGGGAELLIVLFSAYQLLAGSSNHFQNAVLSYAIFSGIFSGFQYATVDGESLNEAVIAGLPQFNSPELRLNKRNYLYMLLAYKIALIGAANMGLLAAVSANQVLTQSFDGSRLHDAYYLLLSIFIAINYSGLDFTLYGRELVNRVLTKLKTGSWDLPALNTTMRKIKLGFAIVGSLLMAIVGYQALKDTFYYKQTPPWWAILLFSVPASITGLQIFNTEGVRLIELTGKIESDFNNIIDEVLDHTAKAFYHLEYFLFDSLRTGMSLGAGCLSYYTLTTGFHLPENIVSTASSLIPFTAMNIAGQISEKKLTTHPEPPLYKSIPWRSLCYSIFMTLFAILVTVLWKKNLMSNYQINEETADQQTKYIGLITATAATFMERPLTLMAKGLWNSLPNINFFSRNRENLINNHTETLPLLSENHFTLNARTND